MKEFELHLPPTVDVLSAASKLEAACLVSGLRVTMKAGLARYPGSIHYHFQHGTNAGTLELTIWPAQHRAWFSVQTRRNAAWIEEILPSLKARIEQILSA